MPKDTDIGQVLEPFRAYLRVLAQVHLDARLRGKLDPRIRHGIGYRGSKAAHPSCFAKPVLLVG